MTPAPRLARGARLSMMARRTNPSIDRPDIRPQPTRRTLGDESRDKSGGVHIQAAKVFVAGRPERAAGVVHARAQIRVVEVLVLVIQPEIVGNLLAHYK